MYCEQTFSFTKYCGGLTPLFENLFDYQREPALDDEFYENVQQPLELESGGDLNSYFMSSSLVIRIKVSERNGRTGNCCRPLLWYLCVATGFLQIDDEYLLQFMKFVRFLLRHGFSYFNGNADGTTPTCRFCEAFSRPSCAGLHVACKRVGLQLLALGFRRLELHPLGAGLPPLWDAGLSSNLATLDEICRVKRRTRNKQLSHRLGMFAVDLLAFVQRLDLGSLTLKQLSRIAVRRAVGGMDFARHSRTPARSARRGPPDLLDYVAGPTEEM